MSFTNAQTNAIDARGSSLLVSAAAGSGKTFTLTHRIIKAITEDKRSIDRMLIVTFTRAAAGELKAKISAAIADAIAKDPDDPHLQSQLLKLGGAHISTIGSFFSEPIKQNFERLGLPASMRIADEAELAPILESTMSGVLESFFETRSGITAGDLTAVGHRTVYTDLLGLVSGVRDSSALIPSLVKIYRKLVTSPRGVAQLFDHAERMLLAAEDDFFASREGEILREHTKDTVEEAILRLRLAVERMQVEIEALKAAYAATPREDEPPKKGKKKATLDESDLGLPPTALALKKKYVPDFEDDMSCCRRLLTALEKGYADTYSAFANLKFKSITRLTEEEKGEIPEGFKNLRSKTLDPVKKFAKSNLFRTPEEAKEQMLATAELCRTLGELLQLFDRRYSEEKRKRGVYEFSDMPKFMLTLLQNADGTPSAFADAMAKDFDEVYVDEYQDVNEIQDRIFALIGRDHRFLVGDIKQSIYGFREAEPSIFAGYRRKFDPYDPEKIPDADSGRAIFMSENFRCDETVVNFANRVCSSVFSAFADSIGYQAEDDLVFKKKIDDPDYRPTRAVINLIHSPALPDGEEAAEETEEIPEDGEDDEEKDAERYRDEAIVTANEIARLLRDPNERLADGSRITAGKIAILVRGHSLERPLGDALSALNIRYVTSGKSRLLESPEMRVLTDLLSVVDNPRSDVPLCRLLCAEAEGLPALMTLDEVIRIRKSVSKSRSLYDAVLLAATDKIDEPCDGEPLGEDLIARCAAFTQGLERLRHASASLPVDKLLRLLSRDERYAPLCACDAFTYLYNTACQYVRRAWNGLYSFLTYLQGFLQKGDGGGLEPISANGDEVRIITIHQSKGLEFPVCFLFGLSKQFSLLDTREPLIFTRELGLSLKLPAKITEEDSPLKKLGKKKEKTLNLRAAEIGIRRKLAEEEARILYVALTRARERLYLSGTLKGSYDALEIKNRACPNPSFAVKQSLDYLTWSLLPLAESREAEDYEIRLFEAGTPVLCEPIGKADALSTSYSAFTEEDKALATEMNRPHGESEEERLLSGIPAKVAASKASSKMLDESVFLPIPAGLLFSESDGDTEEQESDTEKQIKNRIRLMQSKRPDFDTLLAAGARPTAAERGTAAHLFLQYCDYGSVSEIGVEGEIARLLEKRFISRRTAEIIDRRQLAGFFESELFEWICQAKKVRREFRFGFFKSAAEFTESERLAGLVSDKQIFVQGSIDLLIETESGEILLCDYKTDRITAEEREDPALLARNMSEKHGDQLRQYRDAVAGIFGRAPHKIYVYSVPAGALVEIEG